MRPIESLDRRWAFDRSAGFLGSLVVLFSALTACHGSGAAPARSGDGSVAGELLGRIEFPNSGSEEAQSAFLRGVLYLHNFEYDDARSSFREAARIDPDFALAAWGEAMTHNHPIWMQQDREQAVAALDRLAPSVEARLEAAGTPREADYLHALHVLYGLTDDTADLDKETRDDRYREAMGRLSERYPEDQEARAFHALSILGTAHEGRDFRTYMRAAAVAQEVWQENRQHPGAAHYLIHSFDDPIHAPLGLPMAKVYAEIAPDAAHAQHMTSHIFVALGLWNDVATANEAARRVQTGRQRELGEEETVCGHYPYWLQYAYLQLGRMDDARSVLATCEERVVGSPDEGELWHYSVMRGRQILDGGAAETPLLVDLEEEASGVHFHVYVGGLQAARSGDLDTAREAASRLATLSPDRGSREILDIEQRQLEGTIRIAEGQIDEGLEILREAALSEEALPYAFGPPEILEPSWELLGEQLLAAGRPAVEAFENQLLRTPRRVQALTGLAEALRAQARPDDARAINAELTAIRGDSTPSTDSSS